MANKHILRINNTWPNVLGQMADTQIALLTDQDNQIAHRLGASYYLSQIQQEWNGAAWVYHDHEGNDIIAYQDLIAARYVSHEGDADTRFEFTADQIRVTAGGVTFVDFVEGAADLVRFNTGQVDIDFVIHTTAANTFYVDASAGNVAFGKASPNAPIELYRTAEHPIIMITAAHNTDYDPMIQYRTDAAVSIKASTGVDAATDTYIINVGAPSTGVGGTTQFVFDASGRFGIGTGSAASLLEVASSTADPIITIDYENTDNAGDPQVVYSENGSGIWSHGMDTANSNRWVLTPNAIIGGNSELTMTTGGLVGINIPVATSLLEVYDSVAHPIITITAEHATDYDPQIQFRTDSAPTVKFRVGLNGATNDFRISPTSVGGADHSKDFTLDTDGMVGIGTVSNPLYKMEVFWNPTDMGTAAGLRYEIDHEINGAVGNYNLDGFNFYVHTDYANVNTGTLRGMLFNVWHDSASSCFNVNGIQITYGTSSGNIGVANIGLHMRPRAQAGTIATNYDIKIDSPLAGGTITTDWCIYSSHAAPSLLVHDLYYDTDSYGSVYGDGQDARIKYDGTVLDVNTSLVAASDLDVTCGANKTIELQNSVYRDANVSGIVLNPVPGQAPGQDEFVDDDGDDTGISTYAIAVGEGLDGSIEIPHTYKEGTDLTFHVHFQIIDAPAGATDNVQWQLTYAVGVTGDQLADSTTITIESTVDRQYEFYRFDFAAISGATYNIGDQFLFRIERIAASADEFGGECLIATAGFHHEQNTMGSRQITTK